MTQNSAFKRHLSAEGGVVRSDRHTTGFIARRAFSLTINQQRRPSLLIDRAVRLFGRRSIGSPQGENLQQRDVGQVAPNPRDTQEGVTEQKTNLLCRVLVTGAVDVGKSGLVNQFASFAATSLTLRKVPMNSDQTRITEYRQKIDITFIKQDLTNESEIDRTMIAAENFDAILALYDVTNISSFYLASKALFSCRHESSVPIFLVGSKMDLERHRIVQAADAKNLAKSIGGCHFAEVSVALGLMTDQLLQQLTATLRNAAPAQPSKPSVLENIRRRLSQGWIAAPLTPTHLGSSPSPSPMTARRAAA